MAIRPVRNNPGIHHFCVGNVVRLPNGNVATDSLMDEIARALGGRASGLTKGTAQSWGFQSASDTFCWFKEEVEAAPANRAYAAAIAKWVGVPAHELWPHPMTNAKPIEQRNRGVVACPTCPRCEHCGELKMYWGALCAKCSRFGHAKPVECNHAPKANPSPQTPQEQP